ncbi:MAG: hypothetical protein Q7S37_05280 [bacterium]|nr:hypothetical protein [bacterium]
MNRYLITAVTFVFPWSKDDIIIKWFCIEQAIWVRETKGKRQRNEIRDLEYADIQYTSEHGEFVPHWGRPILGFEGQTLEVRELIGYLRSVPCYGRFLGKPSKSGEPKFEIRIGNPKKGDHIIEKAWLLVCLEKFPEYQLPTLGVWVNPIDTGESLNLVLSSMPAENEQVRDYIIGLENNSYLYLYTKKEPEEDVPNAILPGGD